MKASHFDSRSSERLSAIQQIRLFIPFLFLAYAASAQSFEIDNKTPLIVGNVYWSTNDTTDSITSSWIGPMATESHPVASPAMLVITNGIIIHAGTCVTATLQASGQDVKMTMPLDGFSITIEDD